MIDYETYSRIKELHHGQGLTAIQIARNLDLDPRTVADWLTQPRYRPKQVAQKPSKLDPFKPTILRLLEHHPYSCTQIFNRLKDDGYGGGLTTIKMYIRTLRPKRTAAFLTLKFAPGECAQVDWGEYGAVSIGSTRRRLSFFLMVLCHSRMMYLEFTPSQTMEHFLACHRNAFDFFGGVPARIMVDNLKSAVLSHERGHEPILNSKYSDFASYHGFQVSPCNVGKGNEKGRVENGVGYVKKNLLNGLEIVDFDHINPAARIWLDTIANVRIHGEIKMKPIDLLQQERPLLKPLPPVPYDVATIRPVVASNRFRVSFETNRYSVPAEFASARLVIKAYPDRVCILYQDKLIARHSRSFDRHQDFEDPDHSRKLLEQRKSARQQKLFLRFLSLSPRAQEYYQELSKRRLNPQQHVTRIVALVEIHGAEQVGQAMADAFQFQAFSSEYIANILEQRARPLPQTGALHLTRRQDLLELEVPLPNLSLYDQP
ncbi:MAG: IS21 family transposase [Magnetococcales bacterium]|nr:IS21 family transposase [Magnetococcales bacterium]